VRTASVVIIRSVITAGLGALALTSACTKDDPQPPSPTVNTVTVSGGNTVTVGQTVQFSATANFSNNTTQNVTSTAAWESSNTGVATVSSAGVATGVSAGNADVRARFQNVTGTAPLAVNAIAPPADPNPIARFTVTGPNAGDNDICRLSSSGDILCIFDGNTSTGGSGGGITQWTWRFDVGANSGGPTTVGTPTFNPSTDCPTYFKVKPPQTGTGFTQMVVKLVVRNAAGVLSAEVVNNQVRLFPNNACGIGF
jgi:Bacterial Ig-like domain (group 2)